MGRATSTSFKAGQSGNRRGRPKGAKDKIPRGSIKRVYERFLEECDGEEAMLRALIDGIGDRKRALGFLELGARVLDRVQDQSAGRPVTIIFRSSVQFEKLRSPETHARTRHSVPAAAARS